jgi:hypothetical protein
MGKLLISTRPSMPYLPLRTSLWHCSKFMRLLAWSARFTTAISIEKTPARTTHDNIREDRSVRGIEVEVSKVRRTHPLFLYREKRKAKIALSLALCIKPRFKPWPSNRSQELPACACVRLNLLSPQRKLKLLMLSFERDAQSNLSYEWRCPPQALPSESVASFQL